MQKNFKLNLKKKRGFGFGVVDKLSFVDLEITRDDGTERKLDQKESLELFNFLEKKGISINKIK